MLIKGRTKGDDGSEFTGEIQGSTIRIDDTRNLPFWLEVHLENDELVELVRARIASQVDRELVVALRGLVDGR